MALVPRHREHMDFGLVDTACFSAAKKSCHFGSAKSSQKNPQVSSKQSFLHLHQKELPPNLSIIVVSSVPTLPLPVAGDSG